MKQSVEIWLQEKLKEAKHNRDKDAVGNYLKWLWFEELSDFEIGKEKKQKEK